MTVSSITTDPQTVFTTYINPNAFIGKRYLALVDLIQTHGIEKLIQFLYEIGSTDLDFSNYSHLTGKQLTILSACLKTHTVFKELNLQSCEIRGFGLNKMVDGFGNLTKLNLSSNKLGDLGARFIGKVLEENNTLTHLKLEDNCIGIEGGKAIGQALKVNSSLQVLNLRFNQLENQGIISIMEGLENNKNLLELDFTENGEIEEKAQCTIALLLAKNASITKLNGNQIDRNCRQEIMKFFSAGDMET